MFVCKGLRLNKFEYVQIPKRREIFNRLRRGNVVYQNTSGVDLPDNIDAVDVRNLNKVEQFDIGKQIVEQQVASASESEKK